MRYMKFVYLTLIVLFMLGVAIFWSASRTSASFASSPEGKLTSGDIGSPGTVFRYEQTFGYPGVAYLADNQHLYAPVGLGVDGSGNLWVVENQGARAMKFAENGTFLMSIGTAGTVDQADETHLFAPFDVVVDGDGNVWVADGAARVAQFDPTGSYLNQLGVTWEGGMDNEHFDNPMSAAFDSAGNMYVSDGNNHRVQIFDNQGVYTATLGVAGVPGLDDDHFNHPARIAIDQDDNLYVVDNINHRVQIFDASHTYTATLGVPGEPGFDDNHFDDPRGVAVDASFIYVADTNNHRVQIFNRDSLTHHDSLGGYGSGDYQFDTPTDVAVDSDGNLYVADMVNHRVQKYDSGLAYQRTFGITGVPYLTDGYHYNFPNKVAVDSAGNIGLLEDEGRGFRFIKLDAIGEPQFTIGEAGVLGSDNNHFHDPRGVAFDAKANIYIGDCANHRVQIFTSSGVYSTTLGSYGMGDDQFSCPTGLTFDHNGNLYVADSGNQRIQIFDSSLVYSNTLGETGVPGDDNDHFRWPQDVVVDTAGNIFVADTFNQRVQVFGNDLSWQRTLGVTGEEGDDFDHFNLPEGLAVDSAGNLYVAEYWNSRVQIFDPSGAYLTTIGGAWGDLSGQFRHLFGVAVDNAGGVYIPDGMNYRLQKFVPGVPDWDQVNINGFGERHARGIMALEVFNQQLYAGNVNREDGGQIYRSSDGLTWSAVTMPGFGTYTNTVPVILDLTVFHSQLYAGTGWGSVPGQVWRSLDGTVWEPVTTNGFNDGGNIAVSTFTAFNGMLYAGTGNRDRGAQIWRSATGNSGDWTQVGPDEPGTADNWQVTGFANFKGALYAAVEAEADTGSAAQVWRSVNGSGWDTLVSDGFGDANNVSVGGFTEFGGYLYLGTRNEVSGAQLWRTSDGMTWEQIVDDGFGDPANTKVEMLVVFFRQLYAGVVDNTMSGSQIMTGLKILRSSDGLLWEQINPDGFGDSNNEALLWNNSTAIYDGRLHIGTWNLANGGELWRYELQERKIYMPAIQR